MGVLDNVCEDLFEELKHGERRTVLLKEVVSSFQTWHYNLDYRELGFGCSFIVRYRRENFLDGPVKL